MMPNFLTRHRVEALKILKAEYLNPEDNSSNPDTEEEQLSEIVTGYLDQARPSLDYARKLGKDITEELLLDILLTKTGFEGPAPMTLSSSLSLPPGIPQAAVYLAEMTVTQVILKLIDNSYEPMSPETQTQMAAEVYI